jgi:peptide/nickel transport system substrate-binding protein
MSHRIHRRTFLRSIAAIAAVAGAPRAAGAQAKPGGTLTFATSALPPNVEPHMQGLDIWQKRKPLIYENLVWIDHGLEAKPELAERWEQKSPTEYVFHLRRGVKFHDGRDMDADDVKYSYDRIRDPKVSPGANDLTFVKQIDVLDKHTVRFTLTGPAATFLVNLGGKYNGVIPKDAGGDGKALLTKAVGTGPFGVEEFDPSRRLVLKRNASYWGAQKPMLDGIVFQAIPDESSIVAGLRTGQVQMAEFSSALSFRVAKSVATLDAVQAPSTRWVVLDLAGDQEPTSKPEVRQAIALALDRAAILQIAGNGLGQRLGVLPPGLKSWTLPVQELPNQQRDLPRARALLQKAGHGGRVSMKLRNIVGFPALAAAVPVIVDNLKDAGIDVSVETVDGGVWIKDWIVPQSPPTMNEWGGFVDPDQAFHRHFHSAPGGKDFRRWKNAQADELLDLGRTTLDRAKRKEIYDRVQRLMAEDPISIPLYSPDLLYAMQKSVKGFQPHPTGFFYGLRFASLER